MGVSSNTLHLRTTDTDSVMRAYGTLLRRRGYRLRAASGVPNYLETYDEPVFRRVLVSRPVNGWVTVIDQRFDEQRLRAIDRITGEMSKAMQCPAVAFVVADSEALYLFHWEAGSRLQRWCSWPGWYADEPVADSVRERWRSHPDKLLPLCRWGVTLEELTPLLRDYSADETPADGPAQVTFPENALLDLQGLLEIKCGARTYASLYAEPHGLYLAVPGDGKALRIDQPRVQDDFWEEFTHLHFVRL